MLKYRKLSNGSNLSSSNQYVSLFKKFFSPNCKITVKLISSKENSVLQSKQANLLCENWRQT